MAFPATFYIFVKQNLQRIRAKKNVAIFCRQILVKILLLGAFCRRYKRYKTSNCIHTDNKDFQLQINCPNFDKFQILKIVPLKVNLETNLPNLVHVDKRIWRHNSGITEISQLAKLEVRVNFSSSLLFQFEEQLVILGTSIILISP